MYCTRALQEDLVWVGGSDRRLSLFENLFPLPQGVSYNAYLLLDEKTVLLDTVDRGIGALFFENLAHALGGRDLDYVVIHHMEPDHCATLAELISRYPGVRLVGNAKTLTLLGQFFSFDALGRTTVVAEGDTLCTGRHTLSFLMAPMVHWPETMVSYDQTGKVLFSGDAFGSFGALDGTVFADQLDFPQTFLPDARRYYANIVGKYGVQVQALLKKVQTLDIQLLCPLHGPVWRENIGWFVEKYQRWSTYTPETTGVLLAYASIYGNTENAANILACKLSDRGVRHLAVYDVSATHPSFLVAEAFRYSHLVFASSTYNGGIFPPMEALLLDLKAHNLQQRTVGLLDNGSWGPMAGKQMGELLSTLKNTVVLAERATLKSSLKEPQLAQLDALADSLVRTMAPS